MVLFSTQQYNNPPPALNTLLLPQELLFVWGAQTHQQSSTLLEPASLPLSRTRRPDASPWGQPDCPLLVQLILALVFLYHGRLHSENMIQVISQRSPGSQGMVANQAVIAEKKSEPQHTNKWKVLWCSALTLQATQAFQTARNTSTKMSAGLPWGK